MNAAEASINYFKNKATRYDEVEKQLYWQLSDILLWEHLNHYVLEQLPTTFRFLDAGGGTGRWSQKIIEAYPMSHGQLVDLSPDMLKEAESKAKKYADRWQTSLGDIHKLDFEDQSFDLVFNFHNVLGFVENPLEALGELSRVLRKGGYLVSVIPSKLHTVFFNISVGALDEAQVAAKSNKGRFTKDMPYMHIFTPDSIEKLYQEVGLQPVQTYGFPVATYPGFQETQIEGDSNKVVNMLEDRSNFNTILEIERRLSKDSAQAARGNNLFAIAKKFNSNF